jgi:hypothetical protein
MKKPDNFVSNPGQMNYPTNVGAPAFTVPDVVTKSKQRGINATHQLESKFEELKNQYFKLVQLAEDTELLYSARCNINPVVGRVYHLYKNNNEYFISMIAPHEWNMKHFGSYKLTSEHTWERIE